MTTSLLVTLLLAASAADTPAEASTQNATELRFTKEAIANDVSRALAKTPGVDVVSVAELQEVVELEGEALALGCQNGESCLSEIAGALNADYVVDLSLARVSGELRLDLKLFDRTAGKVVARDVATAQTLDALRPEVTAAAERMREGLHVSAGEECTVLVLETEIAPDTFAFTGFVPLDDNLVRTLQIAGGLGCAAVPLVMPQVAILISPMISGLVVAGLGDFNGAYRTALMWPVLYAYAGALAGGAVVALASVFAGGVGAGIGALVGFAQVGFAPGLAGAARVTGAAGLGAVIGWAAVLGLGGVANLGVITGAAVYGYEANRFDKHPDDDGTGLPGLFRPRGPPFD